MDNTNNTEELGIYESRLATLAQLRAGGVNPYPASVKRGHTLNVVSANFAKLEKAGTKVAVVGRLMSLRTHGKIAFAQLRDGTGNFQIAWQFDVVGKKAFAALEQLDIGDFISVVGAGFTTKKGEPTLSVENYELISKSLRPLPEKWHGLKDSETRFRQRYLDMLATPGVRAKLETRAKLVRATRDFLHGEGFIEMETPTLELTASGAAAKPFQTHIDAYDMDIYLRIAVGELWHKRSMIGGFEKIFEIGRAYRNEGVDYSHNPEFTMLEYYWAYADFRDNMALHQKLFPVVIQQVLGTTTVQYADHTIEFGSDYPQKTFTEAVIEGSGIDFTQHSDRTSLAAAVKAAGYDVDPHASYGKVLDDLYKDSFRKDIVDPIFITHYPTILKPFAKKDATNPAVTQTFQLLAMGMELSNSYSEINDPQDQAERFAEQAKARDEGDQEAVDSDAEFVEALEYGMPPATGTGIGIDRFAALLTDSHTVREVTAYPLMKPRNDRE